MIATGSNQPGTNVATASLFAQKLRAWRAASGLHGRVTQAGLAELLGVSVDAISKYERSLSFIRGDLEHQLADALGWSRDEIIACRQDWDTRQSGPMRDVYRLLDNAVLDDVFGGSRRAAILAGLEIADREFGDLPEEFAPLPETWIPVYEAAPEQWAMVVRGDQIIAKWALPFLLPQDEARFRNGTLAEAELTSDRLRRPILPGMYFGYCPALVVRSGHEAAGPLLVSSFVACLETFARRDVLISGIGTIAVSPAGAQLCSDLGMTHIGNHARHAAFGLWVMEGADIAGSLFGRKSAMLRMRYKAAFPT